MFQKLSGNPLASPDFVGVSSGASLFAVSSIVLFNASSSVISGSALVGALLTASLIYVLAWRDGITGYRFILIGIGVSQFMLSIIGYITSRAELYEARQAMTWLVGSVGQAGSGAASAR
ncbi:iron chelate uptake ABC transporter family permease subunit [Aeromicrobium sp. UC242_57]|uniref:iron chelate uptake ABC transporter family permease subunit n=1 Tax=Aeromicrobium sp. UC242_57 TaxID=3374624 RepID=UPI0037BBC79C